MTKVGWDELLKFRSTVFVMEEEYRIHRALAEEGTKGAPGEDGNAEHDAEGASGGMNGDGGAAVAAVEEDEDEANKPITDEGMDKVDLDSDSEEGGKEKEKVDDGGPKAPRGGLSIDELLKKASLDQPRGQGEEGKKGRAPGVSGLIVVSE